MFNGKPVWKQDNFTYEAVKVGDYVEQAIVDAAMDCVPPACMRAACSQMGEPYSARMDEKTGRWRDTYETFRKVGGEWPNGIWEYCGHCFRVKRLSVESSRIISEMRGVCMNDIEKINVAPNSYFQRIVKPCLLDLRKRKDNAKTDMERGYYEDRYVAQAKDFAEALHISAEALDELIGGV